MLPEKIVPATPPGDVEAGTLTVDIDTEGVKLGPLATSPVAIGTDMPVFDVDANTDEMLVGGAEFELGKRSGSPDLYFTQNIRISEIKK